MTLAFLTSILSFMIITGEFLICFSFHHYWLFKIPFSVTILLGYMTLTTYYGLFKLRVASFYKLDMSGHTDSCSLLYSARLLTGLASPLCFNFLKIMGTNDSRPTYFHAAMKPLDAMPILGHGIQTVIPAFLLFLCLANYFEVWGRSMLAAGLEDFAFSDVFDESRVDPGRKLLKIYRGIGV